MGTHAGTGDKAVQAIGGGGTNPIGRCLAAFRRRKISLDISIGDVDHDQLMARVQQALLNSGTDTAGTAGHCVGFHASSSRMGNGP